LLRRVLRVLRVLVKDRRRCIRNRVGYD